ncbi:MAG TPA: outer membrane beta-barrel domain-containing protein [Myxococcales bacterium]|jgi:outer membrane beta-barrel protein
MRFPKLLAAFIALWPIGAFAQGMGLDLTDEPKKEEPKKEEPAPLPPPEPEPMPAPSATPAPKSEQQKLDEVQIANEDRVKSVERKAFLKKLRLEITPMGFVTLNDAFYPKSGPGVRLAFWFADSLGLALRYDQFNQLNNDNVRLAKKQLHSKLPDAQPEHGFGAEFLWAPVYGKVAVGNSINTFDTYVFGGAGAVLSDTTSDLKDKNGVLIQKGVGPHFSVHLGIGQKFHVLDWLALDLSLSDTLYSDQPDFENRSVLQNLVSLNLGLCVYLPLGFDYREP